MQYKTHYGHNSKLGAPSKPPYWLTVRSAKQKSDQYQQQPMMLKGKNNTYRTHICSMLAAPPTYRGNTVVLLL